MKMFVINPFITSGFLAVISQVHVFYSVTPNKQARRLLSIVHSRRCGIHTRNKCNEGHFEPPHASS
jgi:hypothetical protein